MGARQECTTPSGPRAHGESRGAKRWAQGEAGRSSSPVDATVAIVVVKSTLAYNVCYTMFLGARWHKYAAMVIEYLLEGGLSKGRQRRVAVPFALSQTDNA